jgi:hypothetical protein
VDSLRKKPSGHNLGDEAGEAARSFTLFGGNPIPILVSALVLIFSGVSLYATVLKQAHLDVFVPDAIAYCFVAFGALLLTSCVVATSSPIFLPMALPASVEKR